MKHRTFSSLLFFLTVLNMPHTPLSSYAGPTIAAVQAPIPTIPNGVVLIENFPSSFLYTKAPLINRTKINLYIRPETTLIGAGIESFLRSLEKDLLFLEGPSGGGKSVQVFGSVMAKATSNAPVPIMWIQFADPVFQVLLCLMTSTGSSMYTRTIRVTTIEQFSDAIIQFGFDAQHHNCRIVVLDGLNKYHDKAVRLLHSTVQGQNHQLKLITCTSLTSCGSTFSDYEAELFDFIKLEMCNWSWNDYLAMQAYERANFNPGELLAICVGEARSNFPNTFDWLKYQYDVAGGSIRHMAWDHDEVKAWLDLKMATLTGVNASTGVKRQDSVSTIIQRTRTSNGIVTDLVSAYVRARIVEVNMGEMLALASSIHHNNPGWGGMVFEMKFGHLVKTKTTMKEPFVVSRKLVVGMKQYQYTADRCIVYQDHELHRGLVNNGERVFMTPYNWQNETFDFVLVEATLSGEMHFVFFNCTVAATHDKNSFYLALFVHRMLSPAPGSPNSIFPAGSPVGNNISTLPQVVRRRWSIPPTPIAKVKYFMLTTKDNLHRYKPGRIINDDFLWNVDYSHKDRVAFVEV